MIANGLALLSLSIVAGPMGSLAASPWFLLAFVYFCWSNRKPCWFSLVSIGFTLCLDCFSVDEYKLSACLVKLLDG